MTKTNNLNTLNNDLIQIKIKLLTTCRLDSRQMHPAFDRAMQDCTTGTSHYLFNASNHRHPA